MNWEQRLEGYCKHKVDHSITKANPVHYLQFPMIPLSSMPPHVAKLFSWDGKIPLAKDKATIYASTDIEAILDQKDRKATKKKHSRSIDLIQVYRVLKYSESLPLDKCRGMLYASLAIPSSASLQTRKCVLSNIHYKLKTLYLAYPHLSYYGDPSEFTLKRLFQAPDVLVTLNDPNLRNTYRQ